MSIKVGNNTSVNSYQKATNKEGEYSTVREYSKYLAEKYSCLSPGKNTSVSITSGLLRKAMNDEKTGQWIERELSRAPEYIKNAQDSAKANGSRLIYCAIEFGEEYTTMYTCTVTDTKGTDSFIDKWLERVKEHRKEQKAEERKAENKVKEENLKNPKISEHTFKGKNLESLTDSFIQRISSLDSAMNSLARINIKV